MEKTSKRFKKVTVLYNKTDYENRIILRELSSQTLYLDNKKKSQTFNFIIWANDENKARIRLSNNLYIDATFHIPQNSINYSFLCIKIY